LGRVDAEEIAVQLLGDSIYTNPMMLGYAWQRGALPLSQAALMRAIELNGVQVDNNKAAFEWGRRAAHDPGAFDKLLNPGQVVTLAKRSSLDELIAKRVVFLTAYQNGAYAERYKSFVQKVRSVDESVGPRGLALSEAVARYLFKLMAYKDEYEVARLHSHSDFNAKIAALFEGDFKIHYHLAPPLLAKKNARGELQKRPYGSATLLAFKLLAQLKGLRGTALDIFGKTEERRQERALITEYQTSINELLDALGRNPSAGQSGEGEQMHYQLALDIARIPEQIRGFGHVKARHLSAARQNWQELMTRFRGSVAPHTMPG
jgi:indolepyruvate ferredoxin oxidoreductase